MKSFFTTSPVRLIIIYVMIFTACIAFSKMLKAQNYYSVPPTWDTTGNRVALSRDGVIVIYDAHTSSLYSLNREREEVYALAWSSDSQFLAVGNESGDVEIWDAQNGSRMRDLELDHPATTIAWLPNTLQLLSIGGDTAQNLSVWDVSSGIHLGSYRSGAALNVEYDPTRRYLALHTSLSLYILDAQNYTVVLSSPRIVCCTNQMSTLAWSQDGSHIVTGSINGLVTIWDASTLTPLHQFPANPYYMQDSREIPDIALSWVHDVTLVGSEVVQAVSGDGTVRQWDHQGNLLQETQIGRLDTAAWSPYGARLAVQEASNLLQTSTPAAMATFSDGLLHVETLFASPAYLQINSELCGAPLILSRQLESAIAPTDYAEVIAQIEALPAGTIPQACAADLIAVAEALQASE